MSEQAEDNVNVRILLARYEQQALELERLKGGDGGGISGGVTEDWKGSVDRQLTQLHGDVRNLLYGLIGLAVLLAGAGFSAYTKLGDQISEMRVEQATQSAKLDILVERSKPESAPKP